MFTDFGTTPMTDTGVYEEELDTLEGRIRALVAVMKVQQELVRMVVRRLHPVPDPSQEPVETQRNIGDSVPAAFTSSNNPTICR